MKNRRGREKFSLEHLTDVDGFAYNPFHVGSGPKPPMNKYLFKALWGGTALKLWIEAKNELQAWQRVEREILKMEGGVRCLGIELLETVITRK